MDYKEVKKMADESRAQAQQFLAKGKLSKDEECQLLTAAYASLYLWGRGGTPLQVARSHWMLCRTLCFLNEPKLAYQHALLCDFYTKKAGDRKDFDEAYAVEAFARATAAKGDAESARKLRGEARLLGSQIRDAEDKKQFESQLTTLNWFGVE